MRRVLSLCLAVLIASAASARADGAQTTVRAATFRALSIDALAREQKTLRAIVVARGDCVVFERYREGFGAGTRFPVYSVTKSVLALLVGVAIDEGRLRLDETLFELLPEGFGANADPRAKQVRVRDLLTMSSGFEPASGADAVAGAPATEAWRRLIDRPTVAAPGARFAYDGAGANLLSVVLARALRESPRAFAQRVLFGPLRIRNFAWRIDAGGRLAGESELSLTARDMAKIGALVLRRGLWKGRRLVSEGFLDAATSSQNGGGAPENAAYGYLWWIGRTQDGSKVIFAAGSGDQLIAVIPDLDLVVATTAETLPSGGLAFIDAVAARAKAMRGEDRFCLARLDR